MEYFNPLPLYRGRPGILSHRLSSLIFQSTSSIQRKTGKECLLVLTERHFNPLPLYRGRLVRSGKVKLYLYFNPLPLYRGRPCTDRPVFLPSVFQSTSSIQRKTWLHYLHEERKSFQSTSSIQRKTKAHKRTIRIIFISIHFLYTEEDNMSPFFSRTIWISIHFLYTEEDTFDQALAACRKISIHFLYTEEDCHAAGKALKVTNFNPLPLYRGRLDRIPWNPNDVISIHFLYTEEDNNAGKRPILRDISIHFLYTEEDLYIQCRLSAISKFQSTSSIQRKTAKVCYSSTSFNISIHFLYTEEDNYPPFCGYTHTHFNPLPLYRGRHCLGYYFCLTVIISIHFLYTEEDM